MAAVAIVTIMVPPVMAVMATVMATVMAVMPTVAMMVVMRRRMVIVQLHVLGTGAHRSAGAIWLRLLLYHHRLRLHIRGWQGRV